MQNRYRKEAMNRMKQKFDALQVLRALAAGLVVFDHAARTWGEKVGVAGILPHVPNLGEFGVKLFFCISGFIIVHTASQLPQGAASVKAFWRRRAIRIVPLYWLMTSVYLLKNIFAGQPHSLGDVLKSYLFIPYTDAQGFVRPVLGQGWSLDYEMFFYFVFGALLLIPRRLHAGALTLIMTALAASRAFGWLGDAASPNVLYLWADTVILYFVAGVLASVAAHHWREREWPALSQNAAAWAASAVVVAFAAYALPAHEALAELWMPLPCVAALMLCVTARPEPCSVLWRPLVLAGDASYSTYLTHGFFMGTLARLTVATGAPLGYQLFSWLSLGLCTIVGYCIFIWIERPLTNSKRYSIEYDRLRSVLIRPRLP
jgi:exopolysaccharide production protein ExoZ